jgi:hypothetical protein
MLALFETLIMGEALKACCNRGLPADLHLWRAGGNGLQPPHR